MSACRRSARSSARPATKSARMKRVSHGHLGRERGEPLLGGRVAVDPDQRARGTEPVGEQPGMAAAADGAVDAHLARLRIDEVDQLAGQNRDVLLGHVKQCGQEMR